MCEFQNGTNECRGDGYVWDADSDGFDPSDKSWACPNCNTKQYLLDAKEEAESTSSYSGMAGSGSGVTIWEGSVKVAKHWNEKDAEKALAEIKSVEALYDDPGVEDGAGTKLFEYTKAA